MLVTTASMRARSVAAPAAASTAVRAAVLGPVRPARVLAAFPTAVYLATDEQATDDEATDEQATDEQATESTTVVAVVTSDALRLPLSVVLPVAATDLPLDRLVGPVAQVRPGPSVGDGTVDLGGARVGIARWWAPPAAYVHPTAPLGTACAAIDDALGGRPLDHALSAAAAALAAAVTDGGDVALAAAARGLVGRGPGLTPAGDDVLAGALVTLHALGEGATARALASAVRVRLHATTTLSGALLRCAARGEALPELAAVVRALARPTDLPARVAALLRVGSTSGSDLARGVRAAAGGVRARTTLEAA